MASYLPDAIPLSEIRRVLVTKLRHHGDVLLTSPVYSTLKRAAPHAEIDALVYLETAPMLANHPAIDRIHTIDRDWKRRGPLVQARAEWRLLSALRARHYDLLLHLRYAVTRERARRDWLWRRRYTHFYRLPTRTPRHAVEANLDALRRIGVYPEAPDKRVALVPGAPAQARIDALLREHGIADRGFIQAHPGSRWMFKCAPAELSAALFARIVRAGRRVVITGAPDARERALVDAILALIEPATRARIVDLTGALSLQEL